MILNDLDARDSVSSALDEKFGAKIEQLRMTKANYSGDRRTQLELVQYLMRGAALRAQTDGARGSSVDLARFGC